MTRNRASAKKAGTAFETLMANWFKVRLSDDRIERRARNGSRDRGDLSGLRTIRGARIVAELKNVTRLALPAWLREAEIEMGHDDAEIAVVIHKAHGVGAPEDQYVTMRAEMFARLIEGGVYAPVVVMDPHTIQSGDAA